MKVSYKFYRLLKLENIWFQKKLDILPLLLFFSFLLSPQISAQLGNIEWEQNFGGFETDKAKSIIETPDGGLAVAGFTESNSGDVADNEGQKDYWILKLDANGGIEWKKNYGGSQTEEANDIQITEDGGFIVAGYSNSNDGDLSGNIGGRDYWIVKLDVNGNIEWEQNYGGSSDDVAKSIIETLDGGFAVAGYSKSGDGDIDDNNIGGRDFWLLKLDVTGTIEWEHNYGGSQDEQAESFFQTSGGGFALAGFSQSSNGDVNGNQGITDVWVLKLDQSGVIEWQQNYGGSNIDWAKSIIQTSDGGFAVAGWTISNDGTIGGSPQFDDCWILKLSGIGTIEWEQNYGGLGIEHAFSIIETSDGNLGVAGWTTTSNNGDVGGSPANEDYWFIKMDTTGNILWEENYGGSFTDEAASVVETSDGGFALAGASNSDNGDVGGNQGDDDYWIVKINGTLSTENPSSHGEILSSLYPNPTRNNITVEANGAKAPLKVILRDITGRKVSDHKIENPSNFQIEIAQEAGIYMLELKDAAGRKTTRKVIKK